MVKYIDQVTKVRKEKTKNGQEIEIVSVRTVSVNRPCKNCGLRPRRDHSSTCEKCAKENGHR